MRWTEQLAFCVGTRHSNTPMNHPTTTTSNVIKLRGVETDAVSLQRPADGYPYNILKSIMPIKRNIPTNEPIRIFIDCSHIYQYGGNTGIQRVVRNVVNHCRDVGSSLGVSCIPVVWTGIYVVFY